MCVIYIIIVGINLYEFFFLVFYIFFNGLVIGWSWYYNDCCFVVIGMIL